MRASPDVRLAGDEIVENITILSHVGLEQFYPIAREKISLPRAISKMRLIHCLNSKTYMLRERAIDIYRKYLGRLGEWVNERPVPLSPRDMP